MLSDPVASMFMARASWARWFTVRSLTVYSNVLPFTTAEYLAQLVGTWFFSASAAVAEDGDSSTSETPLLPTLNVDTVAGTLANDGELKPVTVVLAHVAGLTLTPFMELFVALTC